MSKQQLQGNSFLFSVLHRSGFSIDTYDDSNTLIESTAYRYNPDGIRVQKK